MRRTPFKRGPADGQDGTVLVIATRTTFRHVWYMPLIVRHGLKLRDAWAEVDGAVGVTMAADFRRRTTYSLSAWTSEACFMQWFRSPYHASLVRRYRSRVASADTIRWHTDDFAPQGGWQQAMRRLAQPAQAGTPPSIYEPELQNHTQKEHKS